MITIADIRNQRNPALQVALTLAMWEKVPPAYAEWVMLIEGAVWRAMDSLAERRNHFAGHGEDALTQSLCMALKGGGIDARSAMVNGNCDVTVTYHEFTWLGEAKIADDVNKIFGGYLQLTERYAKGTPGNTSMGMLLYCVESDAVSALAGWRAAIEIEISESAPRDCAPAHALQFRSCHICGSSGMNLDILHLAAPMKYEPQENKRKLGHAARSKAKQVKAMMKRNLSQKRSIEEE